ncbi:MAG: type II toxin-antitoxin system PemK/MazF family toxin [Bacteroidota bacterium]|nr:type II toxin-antitoxin system PemK/MazF family toxin [Bacteroidota bacterium]
MKYSKGDIVWVNFPFTDGSSSKIRPALVISNEKVNVTGDYLLIQITSRVKNDNFSIEISENDFVDENLTIRSFIRIHKIFVLNEALIISRKTSITDKFRKHVIESVFDLFT